MKVVNTRTKIIELVFNLRNKELMRLRKLRIVFPVFLTALLLSACSDELSFELESVNADIVKDEDVTGFVQGEMGENRGEELIITALYYDITLKNTSSQEVGSEFNEEDPGIEVTLEPKSSLEETAEEMIGFNIFDSDESGVQGFSTGSNFTTILASNEKGDYNLHYDLGIDEDDPAFPLQVPDKDEKEKLQEKALDAYLIVTVDEEEIERFDLQEMGN